jgi:hypothetical protein
MVVEMGYRHRDVTLEDPDPTRRVDRYVRIPFAEITLPVKSTFFSVGYERRQVSDMVRGEQSSQTDRFYLSYRGLYDIANWSINPSLRYELERQGSRPRLADATLPATVRYLLDRDSNRMGSAALLVEAPRWMIFEFMFRDASATIPTLVGSGATAVLAPAGYSRPSYRAAMTYKIANDENKLFILGFERNSNFYFTSEDYDERIWSGTMVWRFGKRGL